MLVLHITNKRSSKLSLVGDAGKPTLAISNVPGSNTGTVNVSEILGNVLFCDSLHSMIGSSYIDVRLGGSSGKLLTADEALSFKSGSVFDQDDDGIVDMALTKVRVKITGVNMCSTATEHTVILPGDGTKRFHPQTFYFLCTADSALNADGTVNLATTTGGTDILNAVALTGLDDTNKLFRVDVAVTTAVTLADNATLFFKMAAKDTGTSGTLTVVIEGVAI